MGGRGAGRSTVASQYANAKLVAPEYFRCAIMRYVLGDIRNSIFREITDRATENGAKDALQINDSLMTITYGANTINAVGFKKSSGEQKAKLKSLANYNCVIIEEADEVGEADFMQLDDSLRTVKGDILIILLLNPPPKNHWIINKWFDLDKAEEVEDFYIPRLKKEVKDVEFIRSSYEDNIKNIDDATAERYRDYLRTKPKHFYNMIKGYVPETVKGKIYSNWAEIDRIPHEARLERYGLDFGYSNDPTAIVAIYYYNGGYIFDEITYRKGLSNKQISDLFIKLPQALIIADSAEPKSIDELKSYGLNVLPANKGAGSVNQGIQYVQDQKCSFTSRSTNIKTEYENYAWYEDKDGNVLNEPKDIYNHAMDALRYGLESFKPLTEELDQDFSLYGVKFS